MKLLIKNNSNTISNINFPEISQLYNPVTFKQNIKAKYIKSSKNNQVLNFYDTCGFESIIDDLKGEVRYNIDLKTYKNSGKTYIVIKK